MTAVKTHILVFQRELVESIRSELLELQQTCSCLRRTGGAEESRKRQREALEDEEEREPAKKRGERRRS